MVTKSTYLKQANDMLGAIDNIGAELGRIREYVSKLATGYRALEVEHNRMTDAD